MSATFTYIPLSQIKIEKFYSGMSCYSSNGTAGNIITIEEDDRSKQWFINIRWHNGTYLRQPHKLLNGVHLLTGLPEVYL